MQTHQNLMVMDFNLTKILKHPDSPSPDAFAWCTVCRLRVKTQLVITGHRLAFMRAYIS